MDHFQRHEGRLFCEEVDLDEIATRYGTPVYVYSRATITRHIRVLKEGLADLPHHICYAIKCNSNLAILDLINQLDCGFDAVSLGELLKAQQVNAPMQKTILSGVGKRDDEIRAALEAKIMYIGVESEEELTRVAEIAQTLGVQAPVAVRVNPDVDAKTHPYISTGMRDNKFGVPFERAEALYQEASRSEHLKMTGVTCHIGSQITQLEPFVDAAKRMSHLARRLQAGGIPLHYVGMGGGLGIPYHHGQGADAPPPSPRDYGAALKEVLGPLNLTAVFEPGRVLVGNAGILLTRIVRTKQGAAGKFAIVDAGMNDLIRPALYQAHHDIETVLPPGDATEIVDVVGPVCESADTFAKQRELPLTHTGDLLGVRSVGAYGMVMASTYNGRLRPAEVLCDGNAHQLIRRRDDPEDLWRGEFPLHALPKPA